MDKEQIDDLKQFIATTVSQATVNMATKDDLAVVRADIAELQSDMTTVKTDIVGLKQEFVAVEQRLMAKLDELNGGAGDTLHKLIDLHDGQIDDHEHRLRKLENRTA